MNWLLLGGSLAGVLGLGLIAHMLGLGGGRLADEAEAMAIAESERPGFRAVSATLGEDGERATVTGEDGRVLRLWRHGAHFMVEDVHA